MPSNNSPDYANSPASPSSPITPDAPQTPGTNPTPSNSSPPSASSVPIPPKILSGWTHKSTGSPSSRRGTAKGTHLGAIDENGGMSPDVPVRAHHRHMAKVLNFGGITPTLRASRDPPKYSEYNDITGPNGEKFADLRKNRGTPRRGGWVRLTSLILIILLVLIALGVGLGVGLTRNKSTTPSNPSPVNTPKPKFPVGSYSLTTFLGTVATACTPDAATWRCYPYETYNESSTGSQTTFNWVISPSHSSSTSSSNLTVSSSNNPFALTFTNATLSLVNQGTANEAYSFSVPMQKIVVPTTALTSDGSTTECLYNNTIFQASLYTKKSKTYPPGAQNGVVDTTKQYGAWPYAVDVEQAIGAGSGVPDCYKVVNGVRGDKVDIGTVTSARSTCMCLYQNYGQ